MDDTDGDALLDTFRVGPSTLLGRVVAIKVLSCKAFKELVVAFYSTTSKHLRNWKRMVLRLLGRVAPFLSPSNPGVLLASVVAIALLLRRARHVAVRAERAYRRKFWSNLMEAACTYEEWAHAAKMLENGFDRKRDGSLFDEELVRGKLLELRERRLGGGVADILFCMRADLVRNLGNMCNPELHKGRLQTPKLIREYIDEVRLNLRSVCDTDSDEFTLEEKLAFIHETRHAFGRTALLLSGGAALGSFHLGVVRTLIEHRLLPRVIAGASVGSIICSFAATRTWTELQKFFEEAPPPMHFFESMGSIFATASRLFTRGAVHEIGLLQRKMRQLIGDLTFQEAYDLTGRVLGISVCSPRKHEPPRLLNYLNSPHVVIWSAVTASCAFPGLFEAQELMAKDRHGVLRPYHTPPQVGPEEPLLKKRQWIDGSLQSDLPMVQLKELFNVNHFIVSQANPHIAPLLRLKEVVRAYGGDFAAKLAHLAEMEVKHRCHQVLEMGFRLGGLAKLFAQDWEGDVTIVMPATFAQFTKIIQNPTPSELRQAVLQGRRATWAKLSAIQANCGIELMLDECVSELNRRRKSLRDCEKGALQIVGNRISAAKRIPSWNCLARESSWGSLDEDGVEAAYHQAGGPWGGPTTVRKFRRASHESDSDSGAENELTQMSWTKAGGPLMRTASAAMFILSLETDTENGPYSLNKDESPRRPETELEGEGTVMNSVSFQTSPKQFIGREKRSGKRANKISVKLAGVNGAIGIDLLSDEGDPDVTTFSFPSHPLKRSASVDMTIMPAAPLEGGEVGLSACNANEGTAPACEVSARGDRATAQDEVLDDSEKPCSLDEWTGHCNKRYASGDHPTLDGEGCEQKSPREQLMGSETAPADESPVQPRTLERSPFGSFISHDGGTPRASVIKEVRLEIDKLFDNQGEYMEA